METKTKKHFKIGGYEQTIGFLMESKKIYFLDCTCPNFSGVYCPKKIINKICSSKKLCEKCTQKGIKKGCGKEFKLIKNAKWFPGKRLKNSGKVADIIIIAEPCKHMKDLVEFYKREHGFELKQPRSTEGPTKCPAKLRKALLKRSGGLCEFKGCKANGQTVHRKIRGHNGGKYTEENCTLLCYDHHKLIHSNEFVGRN